GAALHNGRTVAFNAPRNTPLAQGEAQLWQPSLSTSPHVTTSTSSPVSWRPPSAPESTTRRRGLRSTGEPSSRPTSVTRPWPTCTPTPSPHTSRPPAPERTRAPATADPIGAAVAAGRDAQQPGAAPARRKGAPHGWTGSGRPTPPLPVGRVLRRRPDDGCAVPDRRRRDPLPRRRH